VTYDNKVFGLPLSYDLDDLFFLYFNDGNLGRLSLEAEKFRRLKADRWYRRICYLRKVDTQRMAEPRLKDFADHKVNAPLHPQSRGHVNRCFGACR
jgi:hypothetical protein